MIKLNKYINEAWSGVKRQTNNAEIEAWCEEMRIENYTINSKGEIDVDGYVNLRYQKFKELPYKFGTVIGYFDVSHNPNLISLKNCPTKIEDSFYCNDCSQLDSLEGCPKEVSENFVIRRSKKRFTQTEIRQKCKVGEKIEIQ